MGRSQSVKYFEQLVQPQVESISEKIRQADSFVLTTHRQCDGDGLGAELALYYGLKKMKKSARIIHVDPVAPKYAFLKTSDLIEVWPTLPSSLDRTDLALVFDTNDCRLVEPLFSNLQTLCNEILFIDHH